jgi:hypothetical protein
MLTGVTSVTKENLQLGAGVLTTSYTAGGTISPTDIIGATRGGGSFTAVPTERAIDADGLPGNVKGFKVIDEWVATLNTTLIEFKKDTLLLALGGGAQAVTSGEVTTITASSKILDTDYKDIYWIGDTSDGKQIVIKLKNALNSGGLNFTITNKGEGTFAVALVGHYDITDLDTAPFEIYR